GPIWTRVAEAGVAHPDRGRAPRPPDGRTSAEPRAGGVRQAPPHGAAPTRPHQGPPNVRLGSGAALGDVAAQTRSEATAAIATPSRKPSASRRVARTLSGAPSSRRQRSSRLLTTTPGVS